MKFLTFLMLFLSFGFVKSQEVISQLYYFVSGDEMYVFKQSHDTLYELIAPSVEFNTKGWTIEHHYKIWDNKLLENGFYASKIERLDTISSSIDPYPADRFSIWIYKRTPKELRLVRQLTGLKKLEMQHYKINRIEYNPNFGITYFSVPYIKELLKLKKIKTKKDAEKIMNQLKEPEYQHFIKEYQENNKMPDVYGTNLMALLLNKACLELGYCPAGARKVIDMLYSKSYDENTKQAWIKIYYEKLNPE